MIYNTVIHNGFARLAAVGKFFGLVSAGGIVEVELLKVGKQVFKSKMWVGMDLNHPIDFDEIVIRGDNGAIEVWAAQISMSQSRYSNSGAKALRTNKMLVNGSVQLTGADLTRTAVRVRTNKDIYIGGAAVSGLGWRLAAGSVEEFPVAGGLFAFKEPPALSIASSSYVGEFSDFVVAGAKSEFFYESDDGAVRLSHAFNTFPKISIDGGAWEPHPAFTTLALTSGNSIKSPITDSFFFVRMTGSNGTSSFSYCQYTIYESRDGGRTFSQYAFIDANTKVSQDVINNSTTSLKLTLIGNILSISQSGICIGFNVVTKEWDAIGGGEIEGSVANGSLFNGAAFLSDDFSQIIYLSQWDAKLRRSGDRGNNWQELGGRTFSAVRFDSNLHFMAIKDSSSKRIMLSNDGGLSFVESTEAAPNGAEDYPSYIGDGLYLKFTAQYLKSLKLNSVTAQVDIEVAADTHAPSEASVQDGGFITNSGVVYRFMNVDDATYRRVDKWQLDLKGDLTPAVVEVMELLS
ncbi:hypothetical protein BEL05_04890 [Shewanella colwelliana]|uniref:Uncharacterized protein n=1 Tax=Shewanella colwelliana TaxID=23 RepID=A0A1E5IP91_SHECO|nr:hypothetical protein [Shewanella colwelliana]OEG72316.1 hypothetical protein BEL05_04890 [Shewanella colwelliana]